MKSQKQYLGHPLLVDQLKLQALLEDLHLREQKEHLEVKVHLHHKFHLLDYQEDLSQFKLPVLLESNHNQRIIQDSFVTQINKSLYNPDS